MEVPKELVENFFMDLKKKDIDERQKAILIQNYRIMCKLSQRAFAKKFEMPHSTVQDWERAAKLTESEWKELKEQGINKTSIYRLLRNNQSEIQKVARTKAVDLELQKIISVTKSFIKDNLDCSEKTEDFVKEIINNCNRILMRLEKPKEQYQRG